MGERIIIPAHREMFRCTTTYIVRTRLTSDKTNLTVPFVHCERTKTALIWWGAKLWNSIPSYIRHLMSCRSFVKSYMIYLNKQLYTNYKFNRLRFYDFI